MMSKVRHDAKKDIMPSKYIESGQKVRYEVGCDSQNVNITSNKLIKSKSIS